MNWLPEVSRLVGRASVSDEQRNALMMQAILLAGLCDRHVPSAPQPQVEIVDDVDVHVSWFRREPDRALTLIGELDGRVALLLYDGSVRPVASAHSYEFMPEDLRVAVTSFFDGWEP